MSTPINEFYTTPKEINDIVDASVKRNNGGFNFGQNYFTDRVREGLSIDPDTGNIKRDGFAYWMQWAGQNPEAIEKLAEANVKVKDAKYIRDSIKGVSPQYLEEAIGDKTLTRGNVAGIVKAANKADFQALTPAQEKQAASVELRDKLAQTTQANLVTQQGNVLAESIRQNQIANKRADYSMRIAEMNDARDRAERLDNKAEERRDRLDLLDRQDHRYSQEMQRYDKRRQTETIQSLIGGLASLGAAFAM